MEERQQRPRQEQNRNPDIGKADPARAAENCLTPYQDQSALSEQVFEARFVRYRIRTPVQGGDDNCYISPVFRAETARVALPIL